MNELILELADQADVLADNVIQMPGEYHPDYGRVWNEKFAELIVRECAEQVEQAKNSPFVSLDDAKRMNHFVDVTKKKIMKHFGVKE